MALSTTQLEALATWCADCGELRDARAAARRTFFGADDARTVHYLPGAEDLTSRERRFLGWFMFGYTLPDGRLPAEAAIEQLPLPQRDDALRAVQGHRYVIGAVSTVLHDSILLELEDEHFEVRQRSWVRFMRRGGAVAAHLVPVRKGIWLAGPGWVELPLTLGPNIREHLKQFQPDAIQIERLLQQRGERAPAEAAIGQPVLTLEEAVVEMNEAAHALGSPRLAMSVGEWTKFVHDHFDDPQVTKFFEEVIKRAREEVSMEQIERVTELATAIWNATPEADRGGLTASELAQLSQLRRQ